MREPILRTGLPSSNTPAFGGVAPWRTAGQPGRLARYERAPTYFNDLQEALSNHDIERGQLLDLEIEQESIIQDYLYRLGHHKTRSVVD